jgi:hypothetical protein
MVIGNYFIALFGLLFACAANAEAVTPDQPQVTFGGFGSLGVSHSTMSSGDYVLDGGIPKGPGLSNSLSTTNDSRIAGHMAAQMSPKVSVVMQIDAEYHSGNSYEPEVEFANVKYLLAPDTYTRVGRIALPTFMQSENRDIGYTYAWIHPPVVEADYRLQTGAVGHSIKALYGRATMTTNDPPVLTTLSSKNLWGIFDTAEYGPATFHVGYQERDTNSGYILTGLAETWVKNSDLSFGAQYDPGNWFAISEWIQRKSTYKNNAMYVSAGYRVKTLTPYLTYALRNQSSFLTGFPPPSPDGIRLANRAQSTASMGIRWDFRGDADLKFQLDQVKLSNNSNGFLANVPANVNLYGSKFYVISAVVDFIF